MVILVEPGLKTFVPRIWPMILCANERGCVRQPWIFIPPFYFGKRNAFQGYLSFMRIIGEIVIFKELSF